MTVAMFVSMFLCWFVLDVSCTLEEECNILLKLESLETRLQEKEISLLKQDARISEQAARISEQAVSIADEDTRIGDLEQSMTEKDTRIGELETNLAEKDTRISELEASLSQQATTLNAAINEMETELANFGQQIRPAQAVGFSANVPRTSPTLQKQMAFSTVITNEGGAFNATTGTFTCPVAGVYYFSAALLKKPNYDGAAQCFISKTGVWLVLAHTGPGHEPQTGRYAAVAATYTRLTVGDTVTLGNCTTPITTAFDYWSSSSGFLVTSDD